MQIYLQLNFLFLQTVYKCFQDKTLCPARLRRGNCISGFSTHLVKSKIYYLEFQIPRGLKFSVLLEPLGRFKDTVFFRMTPCFYKLPYVHIIVR